MIMGVLDDSLKQVWGLQLFWLALTWVSSFLDELIREEYFSLVIHLSFSLRGIVVFWAGKHA